jgi:hypothetical protein
MIYKEIISLKESANYKLKIKEEDNNENNISEKR